MNDGNSSGDDGWMSRSAFRLSLLVVLLGLVMTAVVALLFDVRADSASQNDVAEKVEAAADAILADLETAEIATDTWVREIGASGWTSQEEYQRSFSDVQNDLPVDSAAQTLLAIPPELIDGFVDAVRIDQPDFAITMINPSPPELGHLVAIRRTISQPSSVPDLTTVPDGVPPLEQVGLDESVNLGSDFRRPGVDRVPRQLQRLYAHELVGPDGNRYRAWTMVQIDVQALAAEAAALSGSDYRLVLRSPINDRLAGWGLLTGTVDSTANVERTFDGVPLQILVSADSSRFGPPTAVIAAVGLGVTVLVALLVAVTQLLEAAQSRARTSDLVAREDGLTGLPNRRWLLEHLGGIEAPVSLLFCDLDRFKVVNDSAGHAVGDLLLRQVADRMKSVLGEQHALARFGGDEFLVVCDIQDGEPACETGAAVADKLVAVMAEPFDLGDTDFSTTLSIGIAYSEPDALLSNEELIRSADVALSRCKREGRNGYVVYDRAMQEADLDRLKLEQELRSALDGGGLSVYYQPIVDEREELVSYEALVRWERNGHVVRPGEFVPVVAELGRSADLGRIVTGQALSQLARWQLDGRHREDLTMHINVDPSQLADPTFPTDLQLLLNSHGLAPESLVLELVEGEWMDAVEQTGTVLDRISGAGVRLAIDDFGSGYSSISRVLDVVGLAEVKLDQSIVARIEQPASRALVEGMSTMASSMGIELIAEGVETRDQFERLRQAGIARFQGFLFAQPEPAERLVPERLRRIRRAELQA